MLTDQVRVEGFLTLWLQISVLLTFFEAYLKVNKIWIRKHEEVVSESVSVAAQLLALTGGIPFTFLYVLQGSFEGAIANGVMLLVNAVMIMIGIGFWVDRRSGVSIWRKFARSLRLERGEASSLLRDVFRPAAAEQVIRILRDISLIDTHMDERELNFLRTFAEEWGVDFEKLLEEQPAESGVKAFVRLREDVRDYIDMSPPKDQARQLHDIMYSLIKIDGTVSSEEDMVMGELGAMLENYCGSSVHEVFGVYIAPQSVSQEETLLQMIPHAAKKTSLGGEVFQIGEFFSESYASMICRLYRKSGYLTVVERGVGSG